MEVQEKSSKSYPALTLTTNNTIWNNWDRCETYWTFTFTAPQNKLIILLYCHQATKYTNLLW